MVAAIGAKNCLSRNSSFFWILFLSRKEENTTGLQLCRTLDIQETLQVVSFLVFSARKAPQICFAHPYAPCDVIVAKMMPPSGRAHPQLHCVKFWSKSDWCSRDTAIFVSYPCPWISILTIISTWPPSTWDMASDPMPQQLITQSAQTTADAIASVLTDRTASISLPVYDWNSQDAYNSFSIFCHTLENWLLLNCIPPDSEDHLRYVFAALGTKSLEMHAQWMPTGSKEEQKVTKVKASAFLDHIRQGMTHDVNTHVCLGKLEDIVARLGEDPQDLIACIKTLMDWCEDDQWMSIASMNYAAVSSVHTATRESS